MVRIVVSALSTDQAGRDTRSLLLPVAVVSITKRTAQVPDSVKV